MMLYKLLDLGETDFLFREDLPEAVLDAAVVHPARAVRGSIVEVGQLSRDQWERLLAASLEPVIRKCAEERRADLGLARGGRSVGRAPHPDAMPPATADEIAATAADVPEIDPEGSTTALWWIGALHSNAETMRQLARSPKLLMRRSAARAPHRRSTRLGTTSAAPGMEAD